MANAFVQTNIASTIGAKLQSYTSAQGPDTVHSEAVTITDGLGVEMRGQRTKAESVPVVLPSDQALAVTVSPTPDPTATGVIADIDQVVELTLDGKVGVGFMMDDAGVLDGKIGAEYTLDDVVWQRAWMVRIYVFDVTAGHGVISINGAETAGAFGEIWVPAGATRVRAIGIDNLGVFSGSRTVTLVATDQRSDERWLLMSRDSAAAPPFGMMVGGIGPTGLFDVFTTDAAGLKVSDGGSSLTVDSPGLPTVLGQGTMAQSMRVVIASNQTAVPISAAALPLPAGAATDTGLAAIFGRQNDGTQHTIVDNFPLDDPTATGTLDALNELVTLPLVGKQYVGVAISAGLTDGTISAKYSVDGGASFVAGAYFRSANGGGSQNESLTNPFASVRRILVPNGATHVAVVMTTWVAGSVDITLRASLVGDMADLAQVGRSGLLPPDCVLVAGSDGTFAVPIPIIGNRLSVENAGSSLTIDAPAIPSTIGQQVMAGSLGVVIASNQSAVPISAAALPLPAGAATDAGLSAIFARQNDGSQHTLVDNFPAVQPVSDNGASLTVDTPQLPAALVGGRLDENVGAWLGSTAPTVGQKTMANSVPVAIASDQAAVPISAAALPLPAGAATDAGLAAIFARQNDGSQHTLVDNFPAVQPVSDNGTSLTVDTPQLPAALVGGRLDENVGAWLGSTAPTVGSKTSANSVPVVIASDQVAVATTVGGTSALANGAQTAVGVAAAEVLAANANRKSALIQNVGAANIRVGIAAVTNVTGVQLVPGATLHLDMPNIPTAAIFAIREGGADSTAFAMEAA